VSFFYVSPLKIIDHGDTGIQVAEPRKPKTETNKAALIPGDLFLGFRQKVKTPLTNDHKIDVFNHTCI